MKRIKILHRIFTGLFAAFMVMSAIPDIIVQKEAVTLFVRMDMPLYLLPFLGVAKVLGVIAILVPRFNLVKEWAYAGLVFDIVGAMYSLAAAGQGYAFMLVPLSLAFLSYVLYHKRINLSATTEQNGGLANGLQQATATA